MSEWRTIGLSVVLLCALASAGCARVTTSERAPPPPRAPADMEEAARVNTELGVAYAREGQFDVAQEKLERALQQNGNYAPAHSALAIVYQQRRDPIKAEEHFQRALKLNPRDPHTRNNFGVFLCGQKRVDDAEALFLQAAADPDYREPEAAFTNAGVCARRIPDLDRAERHFREALALKPDFAEALAQMASLYYERKDYLRARAFLQRYERVGPPTAATLWIGAKVEFALGDELAASDYAQRLKSAFPESEEHLNIAPRPAS
ncbi:type IV pilus biogenesis/stability protein PilW [Panacagrimonas sp.]|uniref:type IV pilus biogenesis/stability protein PilW n=1 Tax=Panacagrimonas sp. TaxID=2480088 RepID=UPI003B523B4B